MFLYNGIAIATYWPGRKTPRFVSAHMWTESLWQRLVCRPTRKTQRKKYFSFFSKWPWIQSSSHLIRRTCWFTQVPPSRFTPSNSVWGNRNETPWLARSHASLLRAAVSRHRPPYRARALISAHRWYKPTSGNKAIYLIYFYIGRFFLIWWI